MPTPSKTRAFRPRLESARLEPIRLLSGGLKRAMVHQLNQVDISHTQVARDVLTAVAQTTSKFGRGKIALTTLTTDDIAGTIRGGVTVKYQIGLFTKITSNVVFTTSIASPKPGDVKIYLSNFDSFLNAKSRTSVANAITRVLTRDHDKIIAAEVG
jgi:hypothetical protein